MKKLIFINPKGLSDSDEDLLKKILNLARLSGRVEILALSRNSNFSIEQCKKLFKEKNGIGMIIMGTEFAKALKIDLRISNGVICDNKDMLIMVSYDISYIKDTSKSENEIKLAKNHLWNCFLKVKHILDNNIEIQEKKEKSERNELILTPDNAIEKLNKIGINTADRKVFFNIIKKISEKVITIKKD